MPKVDIAKIAAQQIASYPKDRYFRKSGEPIGD
jgi:hypothetical protein